jgi:hypothetical protein
MKSRKMQVLRTLALNVMNGTPWTPVYHICTAEVGGSQGDRRLRELRIKGWPIKKRRIQNSSAYEYALDIEREKANQIIRALDWHHTANIEPHQLRSEK